MSVVGDNGFIRNVPRGCSSLRKRPRLDPDEGKQWVRFRELNALLFRRHRRALDDLCDDLVRRDFLCLRLVSETDAMAQHIRREFLNERGG